MLALRNTVTPQRTMSEQRDSSTVHPSQAKTTVNIATLRTAASGGDAAAAAAAAQDTGASTRGLEESRQLKAALNSMGLSTKGALSLSLSLSRSVGLSCLVAVLRCAHLVAHHLVAFVHRLEK